MVESAQFLVSEQLGCSAEEALRLLTGVAQAADETLEQVAAEVVSGNVRFDLQS